MLLFNGLDVEYRLKAGAHVWLADYRRWVDEILGARHTTVSVDEVDRWAGSVVPSTRWRMATCIVRGFESSACCCVMSSIVSAIWIGGRVV